jgi:hypothetical protein
MITLLVTVSVGVATTPAATTTACVMNVAMCQDTAMSSVICAQCSGWIAGWSGTTTDQLRQRVVVDSPRRCGMVSGKSGGWHDEADETECRMTADDVQ